MGLGETTVCREVRVKLLHQLLHERINIIIQHRNNNRTKTLNQHNYFAHTHTNTRNCACSLPQICLLLYYKRYDCALTTNYTTHSNTPTHLHVTRGGIAWSSVLAWWGKRSMAVNARASSDMRGETHPYLGAVSAAQWGSPEMCRSWCSRYCTTWTLSPVLRGGENGSSVGYNLVYRMFMKHAAWVQNSLQHNNSAEIKLKDTIVHCVGGVHCQRRSCQTGEGLLRYSSADLTTTYKGGRRQVSSRHFWEEEANQKQGTVQLFFQIPRGSGHLGSEEGQTPLPHKWKGGGGHNQLHYK